MAGDRVNVPSLPFFGFAAAVALLINLSAQAAWRRYVLLAANLAFVLSFTDSPRALLPFAALLAFGFASVKLLERRRNRLAFWVLAAASMFAFCWLKRYAFVPGTLLLPFAYFTVGMSYVFFRILHLAIDTYQGSFRSADRCAVIRQLHVELHQPRVGADPGPSRLPAHRKRIPRAARRERGVERARAHHLGRLQGQYRLAAAVARATLGDGWLAGPLGRPERVLDAAALVAIFPGTCT